MGTSTEKGRLSSTAKLRRHAEELARVNTAERRLPQTEEEALRLVHELEIHQIELEMQNAELRLARNEVEVGLEKYTELYDFAPVGYLTLNRDGAICSANLRGAGILGADRAKLVGLRFCLFIADEARLHFANFLAMVFAAQNKLSCEMTLMTGGDSPRVVQIDAVTCASGQECLVAVIDITGHKLAEAALTDKQLELEELNRSLEKRIALAVDDARKKDQLMILQDRQAVMGEMINNIAHQWRQPLNILSLNTQYLPLVYDSKAFNKEVFEEHICKSMKLITHMSQTIDDFMHFFRPSREKETFPVSRVIGQTLSLVGDYFNSHKISITFHADGEPTMTGYPNEFAQVLLNVMSNARDALVEHNVEDARISLHAFTDQGKTVITITDNAGGIDEEIIDRLFDPYFTTKGPDVGTGIGLFMSKGIIEKSMGGALTVRNVQGGGEFRIEV